MEFRSVKGYEGLYEVSNTGVVRGIEREITDKNGIKRPIKTKVLNGKLTSRGYISVCLSKNGQSKTHMVHRLVTTAFIPNPQNLPQVNHLDGNKINNTLDNLEWATPSSNAKHAYDIGLNPQCGCSHHLAVAVIDIKTGEIYCSQKALADFLGVNYPMLKNALNGYRPFPKGIDLEKHDFKKYKQGD